MFPGPPTMVQLPPDTPTPVPPAPRLTLPRSRRLTHDREYQAVFAAKVRASRGCLTVFAMPNGKAYSRLGLSIGKRVGGAVERNRVKRIIREAFRHAQHNLPAATEPSPGFDLVVSAHAHAPISHGQMQAMLCACVQHAAKVWRSRVMG